MSPRKRGSFHTPSLERSRLKAGTRTVPGLHCAQGRYVLHCARDTRFHSIGICSKSQRLGRNHESPVACNRRTAAHAGHFGCRSRPTGSLECIAWPGARPFHRFPGRAFHAARPLSIAARDRADHRAAMRRSCVAPFEIAIQHTQELLKTCEPCSGSLLSDRVADEVRKGPSPNRTKVPKKLISSDEKSALPTQSGPLAGGAEGLWRSRAVCYRSSRSRVHPGNVGLKVASPLGVA
jgi:hypothetical protein